MVGILPAVGHRIDDLQIRKERVNTAIIYPYREDVVTEGFGVCDLSEAPARLHRMLAAENDNRATFLQTIIKILFPIASAGDTIDGIEVQEIIRPLLPPLPDLESNGSSIGRYSYRPYGHRE